MSIYEKINGIVKNIRVAESESLALDKENTLKEIGADLKLNISYQVGIEEDWIINAWVSCGYAKK